MDRKEVLLTYEGLKKLEEELEYLKGEKRKEIAERIKAALSFGDINYNSEYDEAKNEQAMNEARIGELETLLKQATVIDEDEVDTQTVNLGTRVRIMEAKSKQEFVYHIVGSAEADPISFKISNESPVGRALLGHKAGDTVEVDVPGGKLKYKIIDIHK